MRGGIPEALHESEAELQPLITLVETVNGLKLDCEQLHDRLIERATPLTCSLAQKLAILQAASSVFEIVALALNNALEARGYCLTVSAITPQHSPDDVVHSLPGFVAQNNLILNIQYTVHRCFNAEIATTDNMFDVVDLVQPGNCFVVLVYDKSSNCDASNVDAKREAEYDLACQISGRQLLVSSVPRIELQVPDLLTCAIDKREIAA